MIRVLLMGLAAAVLAASGGCRSAAQDAAAAKPVRDGVALTIVSRGKTHRFTVEVARTPEEQARGLMFRDPLPDDRGMLFPFDAPRVASFWMKDTPSPLDIIFIRADGTIESIAADTVPYSLETVRSGEPVAAVLEIRAGRAAELGISAGDRVAWRR